MTEEDQAAAIALMDALTRFTDALAEVVDAVTVFVGRVGEQEVDGE